MSVLKLIGENDSLDRLDLAIRNCFEFRRPHLMDGVGHVQVGFARLQNSPLGVPSLSRFLFFADARSSASVQLDELRWVAEWRAEALQLAIYLGKQNQNGINHALVLD